ncbi:MAG TPA: hypothetical protein VG225_12340 [Terracidiphilus sp.]|jgi:hypothetical protein|nr:hypothetical protein [Terracidiphilus sp.]
MIRRLFLALLLAAAPVAFAQTQYVLVNSTLSYHMSHPIHEVDGTSTQARGKGVCQDSKCDFLIAAPVKSFTSGDSNRDLHMVQTVRGAEFPMVVVRTTLPNPIPADGAIYADIEVQFAGQTVHYPHLALQKSTSGNRIHIAGSVPATCTDFKIPPPSFLTVAIKNEIPVKVDMTWQQQ